MTFHLPSGASVTFKDGKFTYDCLPCSQSFTSNSCLKAHLGLHMAAPTLSSPVEEKPLDPSMVINKMEPRHDITVHTHSSATRANSEKSQKQSKQWSSWLTCDDCDAIFRYLLPLQKHAKLHANGSLNVSPFRPCRVKGCPRQFRNRYALLRHLDDDHNEQDKEEVVCSKCDKSFDGKKAPLYVHETKYLCPRNAVTNGVTNAVTNGVKDKQVRKRLVETKAKQRQLGLSKCDNCSRSFTSLVGLKTHLVGKSCFDRDNEDLKIAAPCHICAQFVPKWESQLHVLKQHEMMENLTCNDCDPPRKFKTTTERVSHQRNIHDKTYGFECEECGICFKVKQYFDNHVSLKEIAGCRTLLKCQVSMTNRYDTTKTYMDKLMPLLMQEKRGNAITSGAASSFPITNQPGFGDEVIRRKYARTTKRTLFSHTTAKGKIIKTPPGGFLKRGVIPSDQTRVNIDYTQGASVSRCMQCNARHTRISHGVAHYLTMHVPENRVKCRLCPASFKRVSALIVHLHREHNANPADVEEEIYSNLEHHMTSSLDRAALETRISEKSFLCCFCDYACLKMPRFREHLWHHHDRQEWKCEGACRVRGPAAYLRAHLRVDHGIPSEANLLSCPYCLKPFTRADLRDRHLEDRFDPQTGCINKKFGRRGQEPVPSAAVSELDRLVDGSEKDLEIDLDCSVKGAEAGESINDPSRVEGQEVIEKSLATTATAATTTTTTGSKLIPKFGQYQRCPVCNLMITSTIMKSHLRRIHQWKIPKYSCRYCLDLVDYGTLKGLYKHMREVHYPNGRNWTKLSKLKKAARVKWFKAFECDKCDQDCGLRSGFAFRTAAHLLDHQLDDHAFLDFDLRSCKHCQWSFTDFEKHEKHERSCEMTALTEVGVASPVTMSTNDAQEVTPSDGADVDLEPEGGVESDDEPAEDMGRGEMNERDSSQSPSYLEDGVGEDENHINGGVLEQKGVNDGDEPFMKLDYCDDPLFDGIKTEMNESAWNHELDHSDNDVKLFDSVSHYVVKQPHSPVTAPPQSSPPHSSSPQSSPPHSSPPHSSPPSRPLSPLELVNPSETERAILGKRENKPDDRVESKSRKGKKSKEIKTVKCDLCGETFTNEHPKLSLARHVKSVHRTTKKKPDGGSELTKTKKKKRGRKKREKSSLSDDQTTTTTKQYACELCGLVFKREISLRLHRSKVHDIRKSPNICSQCGRTFHIVENLRKHERNMHSKGGPKSPEMCSLCGKSFGNLKQHMDRIHNDDEDQICGICGHVYRGKFLLKTHMRRMHRGGGGGGDAAEDVKPPAARDFRESQTRVFGPGPKIAVFVNHSTSESETTTTTTTTLAPGKRGMPKGRSVGSLKSSTPNGKRGRSSCFHCKILFDTKQEREDHRREVHPEDLVVVVESHLCHFEECGRIFKSRKNLRDHIRCFHHTEKRFGCNQCGWRFRSEPLLRSHVEAVHDNLRKFKCLVCDAYVSLRLTHMKKHVNNVHKIMELRRDVEYSFNPEGFVSEKEKVNDPFRIGRKRRQQLKELRLAYPDEISTETVKRISQMRIRPGDSLVRLIAS